MTNKQFNQKSRLQGVMIFSSIILLSIIIGTGCKNKPATETYDESGYDSTFANDKISEVKVEVLKEGDFFKEIISNGKLNGIRKAELRFRSTETIEHIYFKNGDKVAKGTVIARLNTFTLQNKLQQAQEQYERARFELSDILIGQGYQIADTGTMPPEMSKAARIKSGYDKALTDLELARFELRQAELIAPFTGLVTNISLKENNPSDMSEAFCNIIDNESFEAEFSFLESEIDNVEVGQPVIIQPYAASEIETIARLTEINPVVGTNGLITAKAVCRNSHGNKLMDGMNVKIRIQKTIPNQLVIPKEALVLRSEKQVVFTAENGLAKWNYVKTEMENSSFFSITEGLKAGDSVIVEGNIHLAHDARVVVNSTKTNE